MLYLMDEMLQKVFFWCNIAAYGALSDVDKALDRPVCSLHGTQPVGGQRMRGENGYGS